MSDMPFLFYFLSPQALMIIGITMLFLLWVYLGWVVPIDTIRDKNNKKSKIPFIMLLIIVGIMPILVLIGSMYKSSRGNNGNITGTSMNAMGPQPVAPSNMRGALPANRAPQPY